MPFGAIFGPETVSHAKSLGSVLFDAANGMGDMLVGAVDTALSAAAAYGPGLVADTGRAAAEMIGGIEEAGSKAAGSIAGIIAPAAPAVAANPFAGMLEGINLDWAKGAAVQSAAAVSPAEEPYHGLAGIGAGHGRSEGWALQM